MTDTQDPVASVLPTCGSADSSNVNNRLVGEAIPNSPTYNNYELVAIDKRLRVNCWPCYHGRERIEHTKRMGQFEFKGSNWTRGRGRRRIQTSEV